MTFTFSAHDFQVILSSDSRRDGGCCPAADPAHCPYRWEGQHTAPALMAHGGWSMEAPLQVILGCCSTQGMISASSRVSDLRYLPRSGASSVPWKKHFSSLKPTRPDSLSQNLTKLRTLGKYGRPEQAAYLISTFYFIEFLLSCILFPSIFFLGLIYSFLASSENWKLKLLIFSLF